MFKLGKWYFFVKPEHVVDNQGKLVHAIRIVREQLNEKKHELWNTFPPAHYLTYIECYQEAGDDKEAIKLEWERYNQRKIAV